MTTRAEITKYVESVLDISLYDIYDDIQTLRLGIRDTLSDDFQIVCELDEVFRKYATKHIYNVNLD